MFLMHDDGVIDPDFELLRELLGIVDMQIAKIELEIAQSLDPDSAGICDRAEGVIGLGFVACQQYLNATCPQLALPGEERWDLIQRPPRHSCGRSFVELIDASANIWKHRPEWPAARKPYLEQRTRSVVDELTDSNASYVLSNLLADLTRPSPPRFSAVLHEIEVWRDLGINRSP